MSHQEVINAIGMGSKEGLLAKITFYRERDNNMVINKYGKTVGEMICIWEKELEVM